MNILMILKKSILLLASLLSLSFANAFASDPSLALEERGTGSYNQGRYPQDLSRSQGGYDQNRLYKGDYERGYERGYAQGRTYGGYELGRAYGGYNRGRFFNQGSGYVHKGAYDRDFYGRYGRYGGSRSVVVTPQDPYYGSPGYEGSDTLNDSYYQDDYRN